MKTRSTCLVLAFCSASLALAASDDGPTPAAQKLFDAMKTHDAAAASALFVPGATLSSVNADGKVSVTPFEKFVQHIGAGKGDWLERTWNSKVLQQGSIAVVWAEYDFHLNGKFSHCGIDAFTMLQTESGWKIASVSDTRQTSGCTPSPLGPLATDAAPPVNAGQVQIDPPSMQVFQIPSHGALLNAFVYVAAGPGPHPAVILLHGFPGNERNLDLAQDIRRAGWDVLYFNYRGSWGSPGDFSFSHGIEDTQAAIDYLRQPKMIALLRLDPSRIVLIGHSMGGFMAVQGAAHDPFVIAVGLISAADMGAGRISPELSNDQKETAIQKLSVGYAREGMAPLAGCTPAGLAQETVGHAAQWNFLAKVDSLKNRPVLIMTSDDGLAPTNDALAAALRHAGDTRVTTLHLPTDHAYSGQRNALSNAVLQWLATLPSAPSPR